MRNLVYRICSLQTPLLCNYELETFNNKDRNSARVYLPDVIMFLLAKFDRCQLKN